MMQIKARGRPPAVIDRFWDGISEAELVQARMGVLQRAVDNTGREGVSPVERRRLPAGGEHRHERLRRASRRAAFARLVADLPGGSFAFVMATGIVSIAALRL